MRSVFQQKPPKNKKGNPKATHLRAVKDNEKANAAKVSVVDSAIPWKTIVATTVVTSIVSTVAVTFARFMLDRARQRKEVQQFVGPPQLQAANPVDPTIDERGHEYATQIVQNQGPPPHPAAPQHPAMPFLPGAGFANPYAPGYPGSGQRLPLPDAPHVGGAPASGDAPAWFRDFQEDYQRRMANIESEVRISTRDRDEYEE